MAGFQPPFSAAPISAGRTKALWDALLKANQSPDPQAPAPPSPMSGTLAAGTDANTLPPRPAPAAGPPSVETPAGPTAAPPPPPPAPLPSSARVADLQGKTDSALAKPSLMGKAGRLLPGLLAAGVGAATGGGFGAQGLAAGEQAGIEESGKRRAALIQATDAAQQAQATEFGAQQRAQEMADVARVAAGSRQGVAATNVQGKEAVADTAANARRDVVGAQGQTARDVAGTRVGGQLGAAEITKEGRVEAGKYAADAAANRQTRSFGQQDHMQDRRQEFTLDKPTATEDNRADYVKTLNENLDKMEEIANRRPELFGKPSLLHPTHGGLASGIKTAIGTDDPDLATFNQAQHNLGIIMNSAHGIRSASSQPAAVHSVTNGMKNDPVAFLAATKALRESAGTMNTITRPTLIKPGVSPRSKPPAKSTPGHPLGTNGNPLGLDL